MKVRKALLIALRVSVVCVLFALCFVAGGALSGLDKTAQQAVPSPPSQPHSEQQMTVSGPEVLADRGPQNPKDLAYPFLILSVSVGVVLSYLILRSSWHGWLLVVAIFVSMYGISTVASQVETLFFLSSKMPPGMIRAIFLQGAITAALFAPSAVLVLGRMPSASAALRTASPGPLPATSIIARLSIIVIAFVFLYIFFGYYVAWQNPAVRQFYGGPEQSSFYAAIKANWMNNRSIYLLQVFRALLYAACMYPLIRMLRVARWEIALAMALFLSVWTTMLLLPNPLMPPSVAYTHFRETLGFSLVFGGIAGWLLSNPPIPSGNVTAS